MGIFINDLHRKLAGKMSS